MTAGARDEGLQPERTNLAWRRTALSCTVVAVFAARATLRGTTTALTVLACACCLLLWIGFLAVAHRRMTALASARPEGLTVRAAAAAALCTVALALCAVAMVF